MSLFSTSRKSPRKVAMQILSPSQIPIVFENVKWEQEHEDELVQSLKKLQEERVISPYGKHVACITDKLNNRFRDDPIYTVKQVEGKIKFLKESYVNFSDFVRDKVGTGCG
jgi:hypothetical protein